MINGHIDNGYIISGYSPLASRKPLQVLKFWMRSATGSPSEP